jgi:hypothetical protein
MRNNSEDGTPEQRVRGLDWVIMLRSFSYALGRFCSEAFSDERVRVAISLAESMRFFFFFTKV